MAWKQTLRSFGKRKMVLVWCVVLWGTAESAVRRPLDRGLCGYDSEGLAARWCAFMCWQIATARQTRSLALAVRDRFCRNMAIYWKPVPQRRKRLRHSKNAQQEISETAEAEVLAQGYTYPVRVSLVREEFPLKNMAI